jgi:hypothetical protein
MPHIGTDVDSDLSLEAIPEIAETAPFESESLAERRRGHPLDPAQHASEPDNIIRLRRSQSESAVAGHHRRDAMPCRRRCDRIPVELHVIVGMDVDEARTNHEARRVVFALGAVVDAPDSRDATVLDRDVCGVSLETSAVDNTAIADNQIKTHEILRSVRFRV